MAFKRKHEEAQTAAAKALKRTDQHIATVDNSNNGNIFSKPRRLRAFTRKLFTSESVAPREPLMLPRLESILNSPAPHSPSALSSPMSGRFDFEGFEFDYTTDSQHGQPMYSDPPAYDPQPGQDPASTLDVGVDAIVSGIFPSPMENARISDTQNPTSRGRRSRAASNSPGESIPFSRETSHRLNALLQRPFARQRQHWAAGQTPAAPTNTRRTSQTSYASFEELASPEDFDIDFDDEEYRLMRDTQQGAAAPEVNINPPSPSNLYSGQPWTFSSVNLNIPFDDPSYDPRRPLSVVPQGGQYVTNPSNGPSTIRSSEANAFSFSDVSSELAAHQQASTASCTQPPGRMTQSLRNQFSFSGQTSDFRVGTTTPASIPLSEGFAAQITEYNRAQALLDAKTKAYEEKARLEREKHEAEIAVLTAKMASSNMQPHTENRQLCTSPGFCAYHNPHTAADQVTESECMVDRGRPAYQRGFGYYSKADRRATPAQKEAIRQNEQLEAELTRRKAALLETQLSMGVQLHGNAPSRVTTRKRKNSAGQTTDLGSVTEPQNATASNLPRFPPLPQQIRRKPAPMRQPVINEDDRMLVTSACQPRSQPDDVAPLQVKRRKLAVEPIKLNAPPKVMAWGQNTLTRARKALGNLRAVALGHSQKVSEVRRIEAQSRDPQPRDAQPLEPEPLERQPLEPQTCQTTTFQTAPQLGSFRFGRFNSNAQMDNLWDDALASWTEQRPSHYVRSGPNVRQEPTIRQGSDARRGPRGQNPAPPVPARSVARSFRASQPSLERMVETSAVNINPALTTYTQVHPAPSRAARTNLPVQAPRPLHVRSPRDQHQNESFEQYIRRTTPASASRPWQEQQQEQRASVTSALQDSGYQSFTHVGDRIRAPPGELSHAARVYSQASMQASQPGLSLAGEMRAGDTRPAPNGSMAAPNGAMAAPYRQARPLGERGRQQRRDVSTREMYMRGMGM